MTEKHAGKHDATSLAALWLHRAESLILVLIAIVLIVLAIFLLGDSVIAVVRLVTPTTVANNVRTSAIDVLDTVLLVMMTMEIVYTVAVSLESHQLVAEPFLIIGAIAAIRRMLVITAEGTDVKDPSTLTPVLMELGLLAVIVIVMAASIYILRRSQQLMPEKRLEDE